MIGQDLKQLELDLDIDDDQPSGPVECLGKSYESDQVRRAYYLRLLREKLKDPEFRKIEGFPIGSDEDILAMSDPPYYTACPNPFLEEFVRFYGTPYDPIQPYHQEPFAADVSEGKNDPIYNAHSYHTKVPHKAIMRYILHYTDPGDIVFDGFCGTGMTGVAAQMCGDIKTVESLGYRVCGDGVILDESGQPFSKLGSRFAVLNDLSPAATFITYNYNTPMDIWAFKKESNRILDEVENKWGWMFTTLHDPSLSQIETAVELLKSGVHPQEFIKDKQLPWRKIDYSIWSDIFICPQCAGEIIFWDVAVDITNKKVKDVFVCPHCNKELRKKEMNRSFYSWFDHVLNQGLSRGKKTITSIHYKTGKMKCKKRPDLFDIELTKYIETLDTQFWVPLQRMPEGNESRRNDDSGVTHIHHFYTSRNLIVLCDYVDRLTYINNFQTKSRLLFIKTASERITSVLSSIAFSYYFHGGGGFVNAGRKGTLYISSVVPEVPAYISLLSRVSSVLRSSHSSISKLSVTSTQSSSCIITEDNSVDYLFFDPPFGANFMYAELNFIWEAWLRVITNQYPEAVESKTQGKGVDDYRRLMVDCFKEAFRILKPGRWLTVEFSNTKASVWNTIQTAIQEAGFVVANVSMLHKKQGSINAYTTTTAVKQDLVISAYKPNEGIEERFSQKTPGEDGVWEFIRTHLSYLLNVKDRTGDLEFIPERDPRILYDQLVAWYVRHHLDIPISSTEFQAGLAQRFPIRDGMVFLEEQVVEYEKAREKARIAPQPSLFVNDERSAIDWLRDFLNKYPSIYQEIHPEFMQQLGIGWKKHESRPELDYLLNQNFLQYDGSSDIPSQIHTYLTSTFTALHDCTKDDPTLRAKAKECWYVPDPNKASDLEKLRIRTLLREFEEYRNTPKKRLKLFRLEVLRAGFKKAWQDQDYSIIVSVAAKIPESVLQEDPKLLMWYDQAFSIIEDGA